MQQDERQNARAHLINFVSQVCSHKCATQHNELRFSRPCSVYWGHCKQILLSYGKGRSMFTSRIWSSLHYESLYTERNGEPAWSSWHEIWWWCFIFTVKFKRVTFCWFIAYFFVVTAVWDSFSFSFMWQITQCHSLDTIWSRSTFVTSTERNWSNLTTVLSIQHQ